jgi:WD40 repeat protein
MGRIRLWAVSQQNQLRPAAAKAIEIPQSSSYLYDFPSLVFAQRDSVLAADVQEGAVTVWDLQTSEEILHLHVATKAQRLQTLGFADDRRVLAVPGTDASVKLFDMESGAGFAVLQPEQQRMQVETICFSPAADRVAAAYNAGTGTRIIVWDAGTTRQLHAFTGPGGPVSLAFSPDGNLLAAGGEFPARFPLNTSLLGAGSDSAAPAKSPAPDAAVVWDLKTGKVLHSIQGPGVTGLSFSPDGTVLALARRYGNGILLWSIMEGRDLAVLRGGKNLESIAYSPDGRLIVTGSSDGAIRLWRAPR